MYFASPDIVTPTQPNAELFSAHGKVLMAGYLVGGAVWAATALMGLGYAEQLSGMLALLPYAAMLAMVLWFAGGAWVMNRQELQVQRGARRYPVCVNRPVRPTAQRVADLRSDAPEELHTFFSQPAPPLPEVAPGHPLRPVSLFGAYQ